MMRIGQNHKDLDKAIKQKKPSNQNELFQVIEDGWKNVLQCKLEKLVESMPKRINAVITNKENLTKYKFIYLSVIGLIIMLVY